MYNVDRQKFADNQRQQLAFTTDGAGMSEQQYESLMRDMYRQRLADFDQYTQPFIDQLEDDATSNKPYEKAKERAALLTDQVEGVANRTQQLSMDGILPSQKKAAAKRRQLSTTKAKASMITEGSIAARERRQASRQQLMQISEQLQSTGVASMSQAVSQKNQRDAAYRQAKGGFMSQIGAIGGAIVGGMVGGPAGASLGASIGGGIGGAYGG